MKRMLSTKILPEPLRAQIRASGWDLTQYDAISIASLAVSSPMDKDLAIFSSKHAVRAYLAGNREQRLSGVSCLCVGAATASLIRENGGIVLETASSATELASRIIEKYTDKSFSYYCGNRRLETIPEALDKRGVEWKEVIAYQTHLVEKTFRGSFDAILFFSPSGVQSFTSSNAIGRATAFCIGPTTAREAKKYTEKFICAETPGIATLVALAAQSTNPV